MASSKLTSEGSDELVCRGDAGLGPIGDLLGDEDLEVAPVAHPPLLGPERQLPLANRSETPHGTC